MMMNKLFVKILKDERGMGTIEVVVIIAILVAVALIFKDGIFKYVTELMDTFFKTPSV